MNPWQLADCYSIEWNPAIPIYLINWNQNMSYRYYPPSEQFKLRRFALWSAFSVSGSVKSANCKFQHFNIHPEVTSPSHVHGWMSVRRWSKLFYFKTSWGLKLDNDNNKQQRKKDAPNHWTRACAQIWASIQEESPSHPAWPTSFGSWSSRGRILFRMVCFLIINGTIHGLLQPEYMRGTKCASCMFSEATEIRA